MDSGLDLSTNARSLLKTLAATGGAVRLADLAAARLTPEWLREAEVLIGRLIQHIFLEARVLQPLLDRTGTACWLDAGDSRVEGRERG